MDPHRDDPDLAAALRALRPSPSPRFATELDARAAAGFPHGDGERPAPLRRLLERLRATPPRRMLVPAGAGALAAIVVATAVVALSESGDPSAPSRPSPDTLARGFPGDAGVGSSVPGAEQALEPFGSPSATSPGASSSAGTDSGAGRTAYSQAPQPSSGRLSQSPNAAAVGRREIERSARIVLGADPGDVRADAAKVFDAVHAVDGIVLRSSIRDGSAGQAGAEFALLVPSAKLGDALAELSAIGEVRSRRESTQDITAPTVGARERLRDSRARIEGLLAQLAAAETGGERTAAEAKLRAERRTSAYLRARLDWLGRRADLSRVSLRIETGPAAAAENEGGAWGVGDSLDDAGRILEIAAGVAIVGLAVVGPLALIAFLAWLAHRTWVRSRRERALR